MCIHTVFYLEKNVWPANEPWLCRVGCVRWLCAWLCALVVRTGFLRIIAKISAQSVRLCAEVVYTTKLEPNLHNHVAQPKKVVGLEWHNQTARLKTPIPTLHNLLRL